MGDEQRYHSIAVGGWSAETATGVVLQTLDGRPGLVVRQLSPTRVSVSRTRRRGLGLFRRTDAGEIVATAAPQGCLVTVPPVVGADVVDALAAALTAAPVAAPAPGPAPGPSPAATPVAAASDLDGRTVARSALATDHHPGPVRAVLRFASAAIPVAAGTSVVLGRAPTPIDGALAQVVPGDASTVSKSHLRVDFDGTQVTVQDLHSKNGSSIDHHGQTRALAPGDAVIVTSGVRVDMGATSFVVTLE